MEALATSTFAAKLVEPSPWHQAHFLSLLKLPSLRLGFSRSHPIVVLRPSSRLCGCRALIHDVSDGGESTEASPGNGSGLPGLEVGSDDMAKAGKEEVIPPGSGASPTGSRAGLFRTPISGGVHSATSAHDLPPPALAVRNLMEQARFAHLCTVMSRMHHRRAGYPFGSLVDFAADSIGHPIFSLSPLAIHTRNLLADSRCTLVVQIPGWSGLSNARVTIFGDVFPLPVDKQVIIILIDVYFIGGFGTVQWIDVKEYESLQPDKIAVDGGEQNLKELNAIFSKPLREILSTEGEIDDAALISVDSKGTDIRVRQGAQFNIQRLSFEVEHGVGTLEEAKKALQKIINRGCNQRKKL
ncbi:hypothetical protein KFK09_013069 [Dendrobium nobile]|uniref:CREG-like beta-barrel domain-containing protein n=1 Tax=Dendrobium nobile TaxID=94219 RepID=A0A8T3BJL6_DENNO|nr:hypothetical protein KFK09_013069 [Dendrobium nobile]